MQEFKLRFSQNYKLVLAMVLPSLLFVPFILLLAEYFPGLEDNVLLIMIFSMMAAIIGVVLYIVRLCIQKVMVTVSSHAMHVSFIDRNIFSPDDFRLELPEVKSLSVNGIDGKLYMSFKSATAPYGFNLEALSPREDDVERFSAFAAELGKAFEGIEQTV